MVIALLENKGLLDYEDPIGTYLPSYPNSDVTIHQLLSHQSGIPNFLDNNRYLTQVLLKAYSIEEIVYQFCSDTLAFEPGSKFEYSNSNFVILSLIAEKILKKDYSEILQESIFDPLDMQDTYFGQSPDSTNLVTAFIYGAPEPRYLPQNVGGAGGITSTIADLLKWSQALKNNVLLPASKMTKLTSAKVEYHDWDAYYGYGWLIDRYMFSASKKHQIIYHPGTDFGFYSMFAKQSDLDISIILLSNTGYFPRFEITELILNELN